MKRLPAHISVPIEPPRAASLLLAARIRVLARRQQRRLRVLNEQREILTLAKEARQKRKPHNYSTCGGPRSCNHCRAILSESPEQAHARMTEENQQRHLTTLGAHMTLRTGVHHDRDNDPQYP